MPVFYQNVRVNISGNKWSQPSFIKDYLDQT